jgi:hypothetical protein
MHSFTFLYFENRKIYEKKVCWAQNLWFIFLYNIYLKPVLLQEIFNDFAPDKRKSTYRHSYKVYWSKLMIQLNQIRYLLRCWINSPMEDKKKKKLDGKKNRIIKREGMKDVRKKW